VEKITGVDGQTAAVKKLKKTRVMELDFGEEVLQAELLRKNNALALEWTMEIDAEYIRNGPIRRKADIEARRIQAETAINIKLEDAKRDLYVNSRNPFLFRKYMKDYYDVIREQYKSYFVPLQTDFSTEHWIRCRNATLRIHEICGEHVSKIVCGCNFPNKPYDPSLEWTFEPYGRFGSSISLQSACNAHSGYLGRCSDGTSHKCAGSNSNGQSGFPVPPGAMIYKKWRDEGKEMEKYDVA
jgi:hypothetical protein